MDKNKYKFIGFNYVLNKQRRLGTGTFGKVYVGYKVSTQKQSVENQIVAIKETVLDKKQKDFEEFKKQVEREINILSKLQHVNIVKILDAKQIPGNDDDVTIYMIQEFCNQGDLEAMILKNRMTLSEHEIINYFLQIVEGYKYLFENGVMHRDLKPQNLLIHNSIIKIADFGMGKIKPMDQIQFEENTKRVGTPFYNSIQVFQNKKYTSKCDVWALGVTLYFMLFGEVPWKIMGSLNKYNTEEIIIQVIENNLLFADEIEDSMIEEFKINQDILKFFQQTRVSQDTKNLIKMMLQIDEENRIDWEGLFDFCEDLKQKIDVGINTINENTNKRYIKRQNNQQSSQIDLDDSKVNFMHQEQQNILQIIQDLDLQQIITQKAQKAAQRFDHEVHICKFLLDTINMLQQQISRLYNQQVNNKKQLLLAQLAIYNRIIIQFNIYQHCLQHQSNLLQIPNDELDAFFQSENEFMDVNTRIQKDIYIHSLNFNDIKKSCLEVFDEKLKNKYSKLLNNEYSKPNEFHQEFNEIILETIEVIYQQTLNSFNESMEDLNLLDNLFIIYTIKSSFQWRPQNPINFNKFYQDRYQADKGFMMNRIQQAYNTFKQ